MKNILFGMYVLIFVCILTVSGCTDGSSTGEVVKQPIVKTEYVCPDGSTVDNPTNCPKPQLIEKVLFNPTSMKFYLRAGEGKSQKIKITNNNQETVEVSCYGPNLMYPSEYEPYTTCRRFNDWGVGYTNRARIEPAESKTFTISVSTNKDVISNGHYVTTRSGEYDSEIECFVRNSKSKKIIPVKIIVS